MMRVIIPDNNFDGSSGIVDAWSKLGLVEVERSKSPFIWWNKIGDVLLYHFPTLQRLPESVPYRIGLFGNPTPPLNGRKNSPWIFWPRNHPVIESYRNVEPLNYHSRRFGCAFIGGYENVIHRGYRCFNYWRQACDLFEVSGSRKAPSTRFTPGEYTRLMRQAKYGLCLRGYGEKCQREMECLALGTVPIFTPGVSTLYFDKLRLGTHYLFAETVEQVREIVRDVSCEQWQRMSNAGRAWYERNCSPQGSFETTSRIIAQLQKAADL